MEKLPPLRVRLEGFDGRHTAVLESLATELGSAPGGVPTEVWTEVCLLAADEEGRIAAGATWLLRRWSEEGRPVPPSALAALSRRLDEVRDPWARLHLVQALPSMGVSAGLVAPWAAFCRTGLRGEAPFLRAWSLNALVHLSSEDPALASEAREALEAALSDPKASVRARARKILEGR
jgi:hypothetical protein